jgi:thiol-disulfide isomerase/thioredoxin
MTMRNFSSRLSSVIPSLMRTVIFIAIATLTACSPDPDYHTADGKSGRFADHQGKWLMINYWAIWCKPCREEIPELNKFQQQYADQVTVMGVDFDQSPADKLQSLISELDIQFSVLSQDPSVFFGWNRPQGLPMTYVINPQGKLAATLEGPQTIESLSKAIETAP